MITIKKTNVSVLNDDGKQLGHFDTDFMCKMISVQKNNFNYHQIDKISFHKSLRILNFDKLSGNCFYPHFSCK